MYVAPSPLGGRGVFTAEAIPAGTVIELAPVIVLSASDRQRVHATRLHDYYFQWAGEQAAIALGMGSLYNHSEPANADFTLEYDFDQIRFAALRAIASGEEITINYRTGAPDMPLWFD